MLSKKFAVIGGGIAGLGLAEALRRRGLLNVTLFEKNSRLGGHSHTVDIDQNGQTFGVDTGFLVFNDRTYPRLIALFERLGVETTASEMSFAVRNDVTNLEWAGTNMRTLFADPRNAVRPRFWRMLLDIARFNRAGTALATSGEIGNETIESYLRRNFYGTAFRDDYLLPMAACIWSAPKAQILRFPLSLLVHFFDNHGLLSIRNRPQWRTVVDGARCYVEKIAKTLDDIRLSSGVVRVLRDEQGVTIETVDGSRERFDQVAFACHSDEALDLIASPTAAEVDALSVIPYQRNTAVLHTDATLMPQRSSAWSAWNYLVLDTQGGTDEARVSLTYWINKLQPLPCTTNIFVTLNPARFPAPEKTLRIVEYAHPLFDERAVNAQAQIWAMQGQNRTFFAGAWLGYGFHEDGLASGQRVAELVLQR